MKKINKILILRYSTILLIFFILQSYINENETTINLLLNKLQLFYQYIPQQKVYLHFDKINYNIDENIYFKAIVTDATTLKPDTLSKLMIVELIDFDKRIVQIKLCKLFEGIASGTFSLSDTLAGGIFRVRAYTPSMQNTEKDLFFTQTISIDNTKNIRNFTRKEKRKFNSKTDNIDCQLFPEGGYLLENFENTVGVKVSDANGNSMQVSGCLKDSKDNIIKELQLFHLGISSFTFKPEKNIKYFVEINVKNKKYKYSLPKAENKGYLLHIENENDSIKISIKTNKNFRSDKFASKIILFAHNNRRPCFVKEDNIVKELNYNISKNEFPNGISHITLFDGHLEPLCERLVFVNHNNYIQINYNNLKRINDSIYFTIQTKNTNSQSIETNLSISITNASVNNQIIQKNILSALLLTSDLKGKVENPNYYFENNDQEHTQALDNLMLTQGWCRFIWKKVLKSNLAAFKTDADNGIAISGRITKEFFQIPLPDAKVKLTILNQYHDLLSMTTDENGLFSFDNMNYFDTISVLLEARTKYNKKNLIIEIDTGTSVETKNLQFYEIPEYFDSLKNFRKKYAKIKEEDLSSDGRFRLYNEADCVIKFEENNSYTSVLQAIQGKVSGLQISSRGNSMGAQIRGTNSILLSSTPLFLVDGTPVSIETVNAMNPVDVDRVEVLKNGAKTAIYGQRGSNGVIAIYTRKGNYFKRGELNFKLLGYAKAIEFYSPKYENTENVASNLINKTVYWNPIIRTNSNGETSIKFFYPYRSDSLKVNIQGITNSGEIGQKEWILK